MLSLKPKSVKKMYFCGFKVKVKFLIKTAQGINKATREKLRILRYELFNRNQSTMCVFINFMNTVTKPVKFYKSY